MRSEANEPRRELAVAFDPAAEPFGTDLDLIAAERADEAEVQSVNLPGLSGGITINSGKGRGCEGEGGLSFGEFRAKWLGPSSPTRTVEDMVRGADSRGRKQGSPRQKRPSAHPGRSS
jgi:hypothetical protein